MGTNWPLKLEILLHPPALSVACNHLSDSALIPLVGDPKGTVPWANPKAHFDHLAVLSRKLPSYLLPAFITKLLVLPLPVLFLLLGMPFPPFSVSSYFSF